MGVEKLRVFRLGATALLSVWALTAAASMRELVLALVTQAAVVELGIPQMQCTIRCFNPLTRDPRITLSCCLLIALLKSC